MVSALQDLALRRLLVIHPGEESYDLDDRVQVVAMRHLARELTRAGLSV